MEAFADAVFAIAFTLPVVELKLPGGDAPLDGQLAGQWHSYVGFALAAGVIGIYWLQHHFSGAIYRTVGHWFNVATLLFLASVVFIAFPAHILAEHLDDPVGFPTAARFFMVALAVTTMAWALKWTIGRVMGDVDDRLEPTYVANLNRIYLASMALMIGAASLTFVAPWTGLALGLAVTLFYLLPRRTPQYRAAAPVVEGES